MLCGCHVFGKSTKMASIANDQLLQRKRYECIFSYIFPVFKIRQELYVTFGFSAPKSTRN